MATARLALLAAVLLIAGVGQASAAQPPAQPETPTLSITLGDPAQPEQLPLALQLLALLTVLSLAPALVIMVTSFTRILIVLSFTRSALGTQQIPPNIVLAGVALFLTLFTMAPVWRAANEQAVRPYLEHEIGYQEAASRAMGPVRDFMLRQADEADIALFLKLGKLPRPKTPDDVPTYVIIPAFMVGELKRAFTMGFMIFIPFVVIDMIVATVLMSMGMMMMPPVVISLPCKLLLFVLVDGWTMVTQSVVASFH